MFEVNQRLLAFGELDDLLGPFTLAGPREQSFMVNEGTVMLMPELKHCQFVRRVVMIILANELRQ